jgi:D-glycero-alpha-D-manno-heptose-7-phosphate kinase
VNPVILPTERIQELESHLLLFYTGIVRTASDVAKTYVENLDHRRRQLRIIREMVREGMSILTGGSDIQEFGHLLHEAWEVKRSLSHQVSNETVDMLYQRARWAGALGGKLTGAGGGGFLLLFVPPEHHQEVIDTFKDLIHVPFHLESAGSQIIFYESESPSRGTTALPRRQEPIIIAKKLAIVGEGRP